MCGLFGFLRTSNLVSQNIKAAYYAGAYLSGLRGIDGSGIMSATDKEVYFYKKPYPVADFIDLSVTKNFIDNINIANFISMHTRKTTSGKNTQDATHPYTTQNLIVMHNGAARKIDKEWYPTTRHFSDSHWMAIKLDQQHNDYKAFLESFEGDYALTWIENSSKALYIARNKARPLAYIELDDGIMYASEDETLDFLIYKFDLKLKDKDSKITDFKENTLYKFNDSKLTEEFSYSSPTTAITNYSNSYKCNDYTPKNKDTNYHNSVPVYKRDDVIRFKVSSIEKNRRGWTIRGETYGNSKVVANSKTTFDLHSRCEGICTGWSKNGSGDITYMIKNMKLEENSPGVTVRCHSCGNYVSDFENHQGYTVCKICSEYQQ